MSAQIIDGRMLAGQIKQSLKTVISEKNAAFHSVPTLAIVRVGTDAASGVYIKQKEKACAEIGILCRVVSCTDNVSQNDLIHIIRGLNATNADGIIVQLPLPAQIDAHAVLNEIDPCKDVDGLTQYNNVCNPNRYYTPCTPKAIMYTIEKTLGYTDLSSFDVTVVGRSNLVGKPVAALLTAANATVTLCHSKTYDLTEHTKNADIVIVAVGKPNLITSSMVKSSSIIIDVGINRVNGKLCGDVDCSAVKEKAGWITPVPGGIGPLTVAMLMSNVTDAFVRKLQ